MFISSSSFGISNGDAALARLFAEAGIGNLALSGDSDAGDSVQPDTAPGASLSEGGNSASTSENGDGSLSGKVSALVHELLELVEGMGGGSSS